MKKPQLITLWVAIFSAVLIYFLADTRGTIKQSVKQNAKPTLHSLSLDSVLTTEKNKLPAGLKNRVNHLEDILQNKTITQIQKIETARQLARFWGDTARSLIPYLWYLSEAARLENSEKNLTFVGQIFLENLEIQENPAIRRWMAKEAKDLFERSLTLNPDNDSSKLGLGAVYLWGGISDNPMEGIMKIKEVADKDSTNAYAQFLLGKGSLQSGQLDKAILRFKTVCRLQPENAEAALLLAETYERTGNKKEALKWYRRSTELIRNETVLSALRQKIKELEK
ncbi:MAG: tetratricopeptide repeat protein [Chitinophagaceae bacterium]|nr:tetratricopeptide repeat protein [Chitinophagaceae bacterium]